MDLAEGHVSAIKYVENREGQAAGKGHGHYSVFNLGTGTITFCRF
jgi:UDP-glucose 4-epimerase